jgi:hypothetical protein
LHFTFGTDYEIFCGQFVLPHFSADQWWQNKAGKEGNLLIKDDESTKVYSAGGSTYYGPSN